MFVTLLFKYSSVAFDLPGLNQINHLSYLTERFKQETGAGISLKWNFSDLQTELYLVPKIYLKKVKRNISFLSISPSLFSDDSHAKVRNVAVKYSKLYHLIDVILIYKHLGFSRSDI